MVLFANAEKECAKAMDKNISLEKTYSSNTELLFWLKQIAKNIIHNIIYR